MARAKVKPQAMVKPRARGRKVPKEVAIPVAAIIMRMTARTKERDQQEEKPLR